MTGYAISSGGVTNFDTLTSPSTNATLDTYTVSGGSTLLIDTDTYACANHSTAAGSLDTCSFSGIGGTIKLDGTNVWVVPFTGGTGNVPAIGQTITQTGRTATGILLGVWANWQSEPTAVGAAMPSTGWLKIRAFSGNDFVVTNNILSNAVWICNGAGAQKRGWIEVRGPETGTITVSRVGKFEATGDWFELGTTNGSRGQILECPTTGNIAGIFPGVQIETGVGTGIYEWYSCVGTLAASSAIPTDSTRAKIVWQTTSGIRIGSDGTNNVGHLPVSGCKVRIPNIICTNVLRSVSGSGARVVPNSALATRHEFVTTNAGDIDLDKCVMQWYMNLQQPYNVDITNSAINDSLIIAEQSTPLDIQNVLVAPTQVQSNQPLSIISCFGGGTISDSFFCRGALGASGNYTMTFNYNKDVTFSGCKWQTLVNRANNTTGWATSTRNSGCTFTNTTIVGAGQYLTTDDTNLKYTGTFTYTDRFTGTTGTTFPMYLGSFTTNNGLRWEANVSLPVADNNPYNGLFSLTACDDVQIQGIGSYASKLDLGTAANNAGLIVNSGGNNNDIRLKRIYCVDTRTRLHNFVNSDNNITLESVYGDYADADQLAALNAKIKGCGLTPGVTGQASVYGTHWQHVFTATTTGRLIASFNEPTTGSAAQVSGPTGSGKFNSAGQVLLTVLNDDVTFTTPDYITGVTAFSAAAPTLTGTNTTNHHLEYQIDQGSGYSGWKNLAYYRTGAGGSAASTNVTMTNTTGVAVNDYVFGTGIGTGARVSSITNSTTIVVTVANSGTVSGTLTFNQLPNETIASPTVGFKLKMRAKCVTASATNALTFARIDLTTTDIVQGANVYPLNTATLTLEDLQDGSDIVILQPNTSTEYVNVDANVGTTYAFTYDTSAITEVDIGVFKTGYVPFYIRNLSVGSTNATIPVTQIVDRAFTA